MEDYFAASLAFQIVVHLLATLLLLISSASSVRL